MWDGVYSQLDPLGVSVLGGRVSGVGVAGVLRLLLPCPLTYAMKGFTLGGGTTQCLLIAAWY